MTSFTPTRRTADPRATGRGPIRLSIGRVVASEWIKFRGTRSAFWIATASVLSILAAGISPAVTVLIAGPTATDQAGDLTGGALQGVSFTQLLIAALGVLVVTSEYGSGLIRATFTAVPSRLPVVWAKTLVVAAVTFLATLVAVVAAFVTAQATLAAADISISIREPGVLRALIGGALFLTVSAEIGVGFGWLVRSTAGALAAVVGFLFLLPALGQVVPGIAPYLTSNAGSAILQTGPAGPVSPWLGFGLFTAYAAAVLVTAAYVVRRRDA
jgi:hypothetical protein